jgi:peroxiredoxin Q/BCP
MIAEGSPAPNFELTSDSGESVSLASLRGKPVVLYFYPRDNTPGCTAEAYGVWQERTMYGRKSMGIRRSTFVIDADGNVAKAMIGIRPAGHAAQVLQSLPQEEQR